jgi:hypothetical protein
VSTGQIRAGNAGERKSPYEHYAASKTGGEMKRDHGLGDRGPNGLPVDSREIGWLTYRIFVSNPSYPVKDAKGAYLTG